MIFDDLTGVIQAGGQSRRMGRDKALMNFLGVPLIWRPIQRLEQLAGQIILVTNRPDDYSFLAKDMVQDILPGTGALGGLLTALMASKNPYVATVACDMPFVNPGMLARQYEILSENPKLALVIPESRHGLEPMHVVYRRELCLGPVQKAIEQGERRMVSWHSQVDRFILDQATVNDYDPQELAFININTQEEFIQAEKSANDLEGN